MKVKIEDTEDGVALTFKIDELLTSGRCDSAKEAVDQLVLALQGLEGDLDHVVESLILATPIVEESIRNGKKELYL